MRHHHTYQPYQSITSDASTRCAPENIPRCQPQQAELVIDISNRVTGCSPAAARLLGQSPERLSGQSIDKLIAQLPFSSDTPYYNLAYAVFHAANGTTLRRIATMADGAEIPVDITFSSAVMNGRRLITLNLAPGQAQQALAA